MNGQDSTRPWDELLHFPITGRIQKPRTEGITMVIDKGMGQRETFDFLNLSGNYVDFLKLGFGTCALYKHELLADKIKISKAYGVYIYPGGTFLEIAVLQNKWREFMYQARELGFSAIEVSDGTVDINQATRTEEIKFALELGFTVLTEVGRKNPKDTLPVDKIIKQIVNDLENGALKVIVEGRESGKGVGIYDINGRFIENDLTKILKEVKDLNRLLWEAPLKQQQQDLIIRIGPNVNLGNIVPAEVLSLEALRVGLRSDTLYAAGLTCS